MTHSEQMLEGSENVVCTEFYFWQFFILVKA
jgi:hypothetical protein